MSWSPRVITSIEFASMTRVFTGNGLSSTVLAVTFTFLVRRLCLITIDVSGLRAKVRSNLRGLRVTFDEPRRDADAPKRLCTSFTNGILL